MMDDPSVPGPNQVVIYKFIFFPKALSIPVGTTVTWINHDIAAHTATRNGGEDQFESGNLSYNTSFHHTFTTPGTYEYICFYHPGMRARVTVVDTPQAKMPAAPVPPSSARATTSAGRN
jgi:plastocyanin